MTFEAAYPHAVLGTACHRRLLPVGQRLGESQSKTAGAALYLRSSQAFFERENVTSPFSQHWPSSAAVRVPGVFWASNCDLSASVKEASQLL